ncbi:hypothetical protein [Pedobacter frigidisoli]|uniref:hypothetical protein n=1 Tax=Pedobacter frigidisoli TaxID=2530455 RepID=UPI00292F7E3B|nr:hypothetical protein [Pedobacter frigidisoli]
MNSTRKIFLLSALVSISMISPACRHGSTDAQAAYRRYAIKNVIKVNLKYLQK